MKYFLIYTALLILISMFLGCETLNPLCTENFCIEGEIYPRDELGKRQKFSEAPINDAQLMEILGSVPSQPTTGVQARTQTPQPTPEPFNPNVTMGTIIKSAKSGSTFYKNKTVTFTAELKRIDGLALILKTNSSVQFRISLNDNPGIYQSLKEKHDKNEKNRLSGNFAVEPIIEEFTVKITEITPSGGSYIIGSSHV